MERKDYLQIIGDAMEECNAEREREECLAEAPENFLTDADYEQWYNEEFRGISDEEFERRQKNRYTL